MMGGVPEKARTNITWKKEKKAPLVSYVTGKRKLPKKPDLLDHSGTYYVINDCKVIRGVSVANLNVKEKKVYCDQQPSEQNNTAEQSDKITPTMHT